MSIPGAIKCAAFAAIISSLSLVTPGSVRAQGYAGLDCSNPDFFQDCKYYSDVYGYPSPGFISPYYAGGFPVGAFIAPGFFPHRPFFRRHPLFFRPPFHPNFHGAVVHRR